MLERRAARYAPDRLDVGYFGCYVDVLGGINRRKDPQSDRRDRPLSIHTTYRQAITST